MKRIRKKLSHRNKPMNSKDVMAPANVRAFKGEQEHSRDMEDLKRSQMEFINKIYNIYLHNFKTWD